MYGKCPDHPCLACGFYAWQWVGCSECVYGYFCSACATPAPGMPATVGDLALFLTGLRRVYEVRV